MNTALWVLFLGLQVFGAGNINYQQEAGYYELNPIYGRHPSSGKVYCIKAAETALVYGVTKVFPKHENKIIAGAIGLQLSFIAYDHNKGIAMKMRF